MTERHVLAIDLGTSGPKAAIVSESGRIVGSAQARVAIRSTPDGGVEQDPEEIWRASVASAIGALRAAQVPPGDVVAVIASSQYSSIVPVDDQGQALADMVLWMDQRGAPKRLARLPGYPQRRDSSLAKLRWLRVHGLAPVDGGISLTHMRWLRYARPDVYARTAAFLEPMDYLTLRFCGRATANQCSAFMMLLTDNRRLGTVDWDPGLVAASLIDADKLPELVPVGAEVGTLLPAVAAELGLLPSTVVLSGCNDTQSGAIAAGAFQGTHAGLSVGTTGVIVTHVAKKKTNPRTLIFTVPSPLGDRYLLTAENGVAGVGVDHFLDQVVYPDDAFATADRGDDAYAAFTAAASSSPPGAGGVVYLPWLRGSLAPTADSRVRGGFLNVDLDTTRADLARAILEGVALNFRRLQAPVQSFAQREVSHFAFYGGGARSDLWTQIMADVLGVPVHQLDQPSQANSLGAGLFALERLDIIGIDEVASIPAVRAVFEPDPGHAGLYEDRAGHLSEAFAKNRALFRSLNQRPRAAGRDRPTGGG